MVYGGLSCPCPSVLINLDLPRWFFPLHLSDPYLDGELSTPASSWTYTIKPNVNLDTCKQIPGLGNCLCLQRYSEHSDIEAGYGGGHVSGFQ